jgi:hypothetical protein
VADGTITSLSTSGGKATLTDNKVTHQDPVTGEQPGFDPRMNDYPYAFTIISGDAQGTVMEVESVSGNTVTFTTDWPDGGQPLVGDDYFYLPVNPNVLVIEDDQVDVLNVYNGNSPSNDTGVLTENRLYELGMGPDTVIAGVAMFGGIQYANFETLNLELGFGSDTLTIESTHDGVTNISGSEGNDIINVETTSGHLTIDAGEGSDIVTVGSDDDLVDQTYGLLTVVGSGDDDIVNINDSGDINDNSGILTQTTLTGLDMPSVEEVQTVSVRATGGTYKLRTDGFGTDAGLSSSTYIERATDHAIITLDYDMTKAELQARLEDLYNASGISVEKEIDGYTIHYTVKFKDNLAGIDFSALEWAETLENTGLEIASGADISADVETATIQEGTITPDINKVQTLTVDASEGTFTLSLLGKYAPYTEQSTKVTLSGSIVHGDTWTITLGGTDDYES